VQVDDSFHRSVSKGFELENQEWEDKHPISEQVSNLSEFQVPVVVGEVRRVELESH